MWWSETQRITCHSQCRSVPKALQSLLVIRLLSKELYAWSWINPQINILQQKHKLYQNGIIVQLHQYPNLKVWTQVFSLVQFVIFHKKYIKYHRIIGHSMQIFLANLQRFLLLEIQAYNRNWERMKAVSDLIAVLMINYQMCMHLATMKYEMYEFTIVTWVFQGDKSSQICSLPSFQTSTKFTENERMYQAILLV